MHKIKTVENFDHVNMPTGTSLMLRKLKPEERPDWNATEALRETLYNWEGLDPREVLGRSHEEPEDKIDCQWYVGICWGGKMLGKVILHNWKNGPAYLGEDASIGNVDEWFIRGTDELHGMLTIEAYRNMVRELKGGQ